jgi:hypothetical protein
MKNKNTTTIEFKTKDLKQIKEQFECDFGWDCETMNDFIDQFKDWCVGMAINGEY